MDNLQVQSPKIIVRMPNWLGDSIMALPVLQYLKYKWPKAHLSVCIPAAQRPIFELLKDVDRIFTHSKNAYKELRKENFNLGLLLTNSFSSAWHFWRSKIKTRVGYAADCRSFLLSKAIKKAKNRESRHLVEVYQELAHSIDSSHEPQPLFQPKIEVPDDAIQNMQLFLEKEKVPSKKIICIHPAAAYGPAKCWLKDRLLLLSEKLLKDESLCIVYVGDQKAKKQIDPLAIDHPRVFNFAGKTNLLELIALLKLSKVLLSNDSGPMHLADALGTKVLALFGSTNPAKTRPYNIGQVIYKKASCSPCYLRKCPIDFRCMKAIEVNEVFEQIQAMYSH